MNIVKNLTETVSQCGNVLRGMVEVSGKEFRVEVDVDKTHAQIITHDIRCETCTIDLDGDVIADGGEFVTDEWSHQDWTAFTDFVGAK